jgi:nicotinamidase/pyrazinamidase
MPGERSALLVVDVQIDFCAGGALPVPNSDRVISALNQRYIDQAIERGVTVYASRDWHPAVTSHFKEYGGLWPVHCVRETAGALFHPDLRLPAAAIVISKGEEPDRHGYSAFEGRTSEGKLLLTDLRERGIDHLYVGGLATDYCVKHSVLDALSWGLRVTLLEEGISGVQPDTSTQALDEMLGGGAKTGDSLKLPDRAR